MVERLPRRPEQGWSSLVLLLALLALLATSVAASRPMTIHSTDPSSWLVPLMLAGGLLGFALARSGLGVVRAHTLGALVGATVLLAIGGSAVELSADETGVAWPLVVEQLGAVEELRVRMYLLADAVRDSFAAFEASQGGGGMLMTPTVVTFLVLAAVLWAVAQFSAFSVFRYSRGGPAVLAVGVVLFLNIGLSTPPSVEPLPVLPQLALFSALAMLLLMRLQLTHQSDQWARRHIADTGEVGRLFLRTGAVFVAFSVLGASTLTIGANAGPQRLPDLGGLEDAVEDLGDELATWLSLVGAPPRSSQAQTLDGDLDVNLDWEQRDGLAFRATLPPDEAGTYWWISAHDRFDGYTWSTSDAQTVPLGQGQPITMTRGVTEGLLRRVTATIDPEEQWFAGTVVGPAAFARVAEAVDLKVIDAVGADVGRVEFRRIPDRVPAYEVQAEVRDYDGRPTGLTAAELRAAPTRYDDWVRERYLQGVGTEASGPLTQAKAAELQAAYDNPYDMAVAIQDELASWEYKTTMSDICGEATLSECVLEHQQGFCQLYASAMAMVLREAGVPTRVVRGFLPGELRDGVWEVPNAAFHAWVEVYFPGYGWIRFDPTPGQIQERYDLAQTDLPPGEEIPPEVPISSPIPIPSEEPLFTPEPTEDPFAAGDLELTCEELGTCPEDDTALAAFIIGGGIAGALLVVVTLLLFVRFRRLPGADTGLAYRGIVSLATRLGLGPHPSQTEYEYASTLSEALPDVRDDLYLVAAIQVETAYGRRTLDRGRLDTLKRAYARIRTALLRLSLRRR
jgi:hypothetical protein